MQIVAMGETKIKSLGVGNGCENRKKCMVSWYCLWLGRGHFTKFRVGYARIVVSLRALGR